MRKEGIIGILTLTFMLFFSAQTPARAAYPEKPMTMLVWGTPGSATDILARNLALFSEKSFGQQIQVMNKPGGSGIVAMSFLQNKPTDGYWSLLITNSMIPVLLKGTQPFNLDSFEYVIRIVTDPLFLTVRKESPYKSLEDFVEVAKKKPGEIRLSGALRGGIYELTAFEIMQAAGIKINYIPYEGNRDAVIAAVGGHVDAALCALSPMLGLVKSGDVKLLVSTAMEPEEELKVPTFTEKKLNVTGNMWRGVAVKKGTSAEIIERLHSTFKKAILSPEWKEKYLDKYQQKQGYMEPAEFTRAMKGEEKTTRAFLESMEKAK
ncbi:MAG: tripartite tricarboxylate transporter substrate binding protein [Deltaproteobacteria bacterium]|nr:tripartite tricarboxylate transporter substrate binding protein [Deltaproteobacteria bacterium]